MSFETPRSTVPSARSIEARDDRFYTPRLISQASNGCGSEFDWSTARSTRSDGEFATPRDNFLQDTSYFVDRSYQPAPRSASNRSFKLREDIPFPFQPGPSSHSSNREQPTYGRNYEDHTLTAINPSQDDIESIFSYARHDRREEIETCLNRGIPVDIRDEYGNTMLVTACQNNNKRMAKLLLRRGANINARNFRGNTPLHYCYHYGYGESLGEYLISKGADASIRNNVGKLCLEGI